MIGNFTYDEIMQFSKELKDNIKIIEAMSKNKNLTKLQDFVSNVDWYSKFLSSSIELYKDADNALANIEK